jgi:glycosyltransferase 2 family protein
MGRDAVELFEPPRSVRRFAPGDLLRLIVGVGLVALGWVLARWGQSTIEGLEADVLRAFGRLPDTIETVALSVAQLLVSVTPTVALAVLVWKRRWRIVALLVLTSALATLAMLAADAVVFDDRLRDAFAELVEEDDGFDPNTFPDSNTIASTVAVVIVAVPWMSRRWRHALWVGVGGLAVLRLLAVDAPALDLVLAFGVGTVVGSAVLLVFGSPIAEPLPDELLDAVRRAGYDPVRIDRPPQRGDVRRYRLVQSDGAILDVGLRTPDERDAALMERTYRRIRLNSSEVRAPFASVKRRIEHEALVLGLARTAGARVPRVERIGTTDRGSAFLVLRHEELAPVTDADLGRPGVLGDLWAQIRAIHDAGVDHGELGLESLRIDTEGHVWIIDFDHAETAGTPRDMARDVAQLLVETARVVGAEAATSAAVRALGPDAVAPALRMLQPLALPGPTRERAKSVDGLLDDLRVEVNRATGEPGLELEELERLKPRTLLIVVASTLAFYSLLPQLANLEDTVDAFGDAQAVWLIGILAASAVTYVFAAFSFQGAVADPIPFAPNLRAQLAASFAGLVGPAGAGGFALTARFLERVGVNRAEAGTSVAVNAVAGFAVHAVLLVGFIVWTGRADLGGFSLPGVGTLLIVGALVLVAIGVVVGVGPVRRRVLAPAVRGAKDGIVQMGRVFTSPVRVLGLFGGSAGVSLAYVVAIACSVEAFGGGVSFPQIGAAYLFAVAIATLSPTPGGLGALESALIAGLTGFGMPAGAAVSATLTFRLATFWLPILPGWAAFGYMQRRDEI